MCAAHKKKEHKRKKEEVRLNVGGGESQQRRSSESSGMGGGGAAVDGVNGQGTKEERRGTGGLDILQGERQEQQVSSSAQNVRSSHSFFSYYTMRRSFCFFLVSFAHWRFYGRKSPLRIFGGKYMQCFSPSFLCSIDCRQLT